MALRCLQEWDCLSYRIFLFGSPLTSLAPLPLKDTGRLHGSSFLDCQLVTSDGVIYILSSALAQWWRHICAQASTQWPPVTGIQTSRSHHAPSSALWRVGGAGGGQCSLPFPPPLWALHNLAFSFLWANSASDNVTVLKAWWPYTFNLLGNSDWKYCVLLSGCVRSSLEFGKAGNISRMHALRVDVLGVMSNPPAPSLQWQTLIILKFRIPLRQSNSTLSYLISRKCLQRMMKSRWWQ